MFFTIYEGFIFYKKTLLAFILHFNYLLFPQWYSNWDNRKTITNNLAQGGDLTDFPLLVIISNDSDLANYASNNGYDILFTPGVNTNKLVSHTITIEYTESRKGTERIIAFLLRFRIVSKPRCSRTS
ncbi:MAG: hypothetical protein A2096_03925 [Spirochaetes bacterium GWF1_41_5]|nr:MAG: hypothetical protein A2096_03925 [Spirochaetes bacterium GWF1_41_5]